MSWDRREHKICAGCQRRKMWTEFGFLGRSDTCHACAHRTGSPVGRRLPAPRPIPPQEWT